MLLVDGKHLEGHLLRYAVDGYHDTDGDVWLGVGVDWYKCTGVIDNDGIMAFGNANCGRIVMFSILISN